MKSKKQLSIVLMAILVVSAFSAVLIAVAVNTIAEESAGFTVSEEMKRPAEAGYAGSGPTPPVERTFLEITGKVITIDGDPSDWAGISPICIDPHGDSVDGWPDDDIWDVYVTDDGTNLYFRVDLAYMPALTWLYLDMDVDKDINTGYNTDIDPCDWYIKPHGTGIDYKIEISPVDHTCDLYRLDVLDQTVCDVNWVYLGSVPCGCGEVVETAVPLSAIGETGSPCLNMEYQTYWYYSQDECPDTGHVTYEDCCVETAVYQAGVPDPNEILNPLRAMRDGYLKTEDVDRYYDYSPELTMVMTKDPALAYEAARLLVKYSPMVEQEVYGIGMDKLITGRDVEEIVSFTDGLKRSVSKNRGEVGATRSQEIIKYLDVFKGQVEASEGKTFSEALQDSIYYKGQIPRIPRPGAQQHHGRQ